MQKIELSKEQYKLLNAAVKSTIAAPNSGRPILEYAKIEVTETDITVISLDGYKMSVLKLELKNETEPFECLYQHLISFPPKGKKVIIEKIDENTCRVSIPTEDGSVSSTDIKQPNGEYVRWQLCLPDNDHVTRIGFSPKLLAETLQPYKLAGVELVVLDFATKCDGIDPTQPVRISASLKNAELKSIVLPIKIN